MGSPDQPRDWHGRWGQGGPSSTSAASAPGTKSPFAQAVDRREGRVAAAMGDRSKIAWAHREYKKEVAALRPKAPRGGSDQYKADLAAARAKLGRDPKSGK
jgi:hypothetical protein